jgi:hypothetical protein
MAFTKFVQDFSTENMHKVMMKLSYILKMRI